MRKLNLFIGNTPVKGTAMLLRNGFVLGINSQGMDLEIWFYKRSTRRNKYGKFCLSLKG